MSDQRRDPADRSRREEPPKGWATEWVNDDCLCEARAIYDWHANTDGSFTPRLRRFHFARSLFCGIDHSAELESWRSLVGAADSPPLTRPERFLAQGNSEG